MFFIHKKTIQDYILEVLSRGPLGTLDLIVRIKKLRPGTSKQGVYNVLQTLNKEEVVVVNKGVVSLNTNWLRKLGRFALTAEQHYSANVVLPDYFVNLAEGDRLRYYFKSVAQLASAWTHIITVLMQKLPVGEHLFCYNPHFWFIYKYIEDGIASLKNYPETDRLLLMLIGCKTKLSKLAGEKIRGDYVQYYILGEPLFEKNNYHVNIFGDFVFEVWLDNEVMSRVESIFTDKKELTTKVLKEIQDIMQMPGKNKLVLSRNSKKAIRLRKKLGKYFYIPKTKHV